jgi:2-dehydro-3-deoxy-D-arabinonate dehydratase
MKLTQILHNGALAAAIVEDGKYRPVPNQTTASLIAQAQASGKPLAEIARALAHGTLIEADPVIPIHPAEVWACGCTYAPSAEFRDGETGTREGMYAYVHNVDHRPELFEKGGSRVCVGPGEGIGIRKDSKFTAPEPELALIVDSDGKIHGYTLANDVSAWDIERENALYLPQSKIFDACCALGPVVVTADEIANPYDLMITCTITRDGKQTFSGSCSTNKLRRKLEQLVEYLLRSNSVPTPVALLTGTGIIVTEEVALKPGDVTTIEMAEIGSLSNPARLV